MRKFPKIMKITEIVRAQNETGKAIRIVYKLPRYKLALKDLDNPGT